MRVDPPAMSGVSVFIKDFREIPHLFPPCEDTARRWPSMYQNAGLHQTLNLLEP